MSSNVKETLIISGLLHNPDFQHKVLPHLKAEYFETESCGVIYSLVKEYNDKYEAFPTQEILEVSLENSNGLAEPIYQSAKNMIENLYTEKVINGIQNQNLDWMITTAETHIRNRACYLAVVDSYGIVSGTDTKRSIDAIPDMLKEATGICFNNDLGHDYIDDFKDRYDFYHNEENKIPFALTMLNHVTNGGIPRKTLVVPVAPPGGGKSIFLTDYASFLLMAGYNVLFITLELSKERVMQRVDAKLFDINVHALEELDYDTFKNKIDNIKRKKIGKLKCNEYANNTFNCNHLKSLLKEYKNKQNFVPDVIMVDYLGIMQSARLQSGGNQSYYIKSIAEELRAVAQLNDCVVISPQQSTRDTVGSADFDMDSVADSIGIPQTCDMMFGIITTPELEQLGHIRIRQMKNRFGDLFKPNSFLIGADKAKMSFYDVDLPNKMTSKAPKEEIEDLSDNDLFNKPSIKKGGLKF